MDYQEALKYLYEKLPMYQRSGAVAYKDNLDNTLALDRLFQNPHRAFKSIHVAGTNGKGSVSHMLASVLIACGYKVGLYTSPHLKDYRERIRVNGKKIKKKAVCRFLDSFFQKNTFNIAPSFFELSVAMAFDYFREQQVDFAVIEVGLGGRLDSTNIIVPILSVITNIGYDHTHLLGNTLELIAAEKAGIVKKSTPVVIGETHSETEKVFRRIANDLSAPILFADQEYKLETNKDGTKNLFRGEKLVLKDIATDLKGIYQHKNMLSSLAVLLYLKEQAYQLPEECLRKGLNSVMQLGKLRGRWQQIAEKPRVICDNGHNEDGIREVVKQLKNEKYSKLHLVFGTVNDKKLDGILAILPKNARYYFVRPNVDRGLAANKLMDMAVSFGLNGHIYPSAKDALKSARKNAREDDLIFVGGSTFVVAEVL